MRNLKSRKVDAKQIRERTGLSQPAFAARYGISVATLRQWEQGAREPAGAALTLLRLIKREPNTIARILSNNEPQAENGT